MKSICLILTGISLLFSCKRNTNTPFDSLLTGQWILDSISGDFNKWDRDFVFISDRGAFWKFTFWNDLYLVDSCLAIKGSCVFNKKQKIYQIQLLDSSTMKTRDSLGNEFFYRLQNKSWNRENRDDLTNFIHRNSTHQQLIGWWELAHATSSPILLMNYHDTINEFSLCLDSKGKAEVYIDEITDSIIEYYWLADSMGISCRRGCFIGNDRILEIDNNKFVLELSTRRNYIPVKDTLTFTRRLPKMPDFKTQF